MSTSMGQALGGRNVSRETFDALQAFAAKVERWTPAINLVSKTSVQQLWDRHIVDSAQLFDLRPEGARHWADLGSGGGFPGIVLAILAREVDSDLRFTLVEADLRKATFLRQAAHDLGLAVAVEAKRIESLPPLAADVVSARALAPLEDLLALGARHIRPDGIALFPKGARHVEEIAAARKRWGFDVEIHASRSDKDAAILIIRNIERAEQN